MTDAAGIPSVFTGGDVFALVGPVAPDRRKIIKITGDAISGYQSEVVKDYDVLFSLRQDVQAAMAEHETADADDPPEEQQYLVTAWQAMALYLANADDTDQAPAMTILKLISALMSPDGNGSQVMPSGSFGLVVANNYSSLESAAGNSFTCPQCSRTFGTEQGLINHLKNVHAKREKTPYPKSKNDAPVSPKD